MVLVDRGDFSKNFALVFALFGLNKLDKLFSECLQLMNSSTKFNRNRNSFCKTTRSALIKNEQGVQITVWRLYYMSFHLLELGEEEGNFLDEIVISRQLRSSVSIYRYSVPNIERMLDKDEYN